MPDLARLDVAVPGLVAAVVDELRGEVDAWAERHLLLVRSQVPEYDVLSDEEITSSARSMLREEVVALDRLRIPDDVLLVQLEATALDRIARGIPSEALTLGYQLASRELLAVMDRIAARVGLPHDVLLAVHDSTWELANDAAAVFARVQRDLSVVRARLDAERRSSFARAVLGGRLSAEQVQREAPLFGLDPRASHVALAARADSPGAAEAVRRAISVALRAAPDSLVFGDMGSSLGCIAPSAPADVPGHLVAVGPASRLEALAGGFEDALLALGTAERFGGAGVVRLADLGPRPLVLMAPAAAAGLEERHLAALSGGGRFGAEVETTMRVFLDCDQQVDSAARLLTVHPNTVRYRVRRFREMTGLDVTRTEDLVSSWWLLNRRRGAPASPA